MMGLFEKITIKWFETIAMSYGPDSEDDTRKQLKSAFGRLVPSQDWLKFEGGVISSLGKQTKIGVSAPTEITP